MDFIEGDRFLFKYDRMTHFLNWSAQSRGTVGAIEAEEGFEVNVSDRFYQSVSSSIMGT
jgi:hypothetical protein